MHRSIYALALALAGVACVGLVLAAHLRRARSGAANAGRAADWQEECAVSECGPDGVPLSLYAR